MIHFPSIAQFKDVVQDQRRSSLADGLVNIQFIGTVKLHGTNAAFVSDGKTSHCQSRNRILTLESDNLGFCKFTLEKTHVFESLVKKALELVEPVHGTDGKIALFGEWCGGNIQKHVGLEHLPRMFVIFDALFISSDKKEHWLTHDVVAKILVEPHDDQSVFNIYSFPTFQITIDFADPGQAQADLNQKTLMVENDCPVTAAFGYKDQVGEGIVWRQTAFDNNESPIRFKTKGDKHSGRGVNKNPVTIGHAKLTSIHDFCQHCLHDARLNQGLEYLTEQGLDHSIQNLGAFLTWINRDIVKEESNTLKANNLEWKDVAKVIGEKAKTWYQQVKE